MKTKENVETKSQTVEATILKTKTKSLRPMPSLSARRSFRPKTVVANMILKDESAKSN